MAKIITGRLSFGENEVIFSPYQSGFRRGTMDSIVRLESDIRKALTNEDAVVAVFFDIEKDYMLRKEGLLIKLEQIGIGYIIGLNHF